MPLLLPYVAGLFDGEGCFQVVRHRTTLVPRVLVVNTSRDVLDLLKAQFGGDISPMKRRKALWKTAYQWRLSNQAALNFMSAIEPWLRIKQEQAHLACAIDATRPGYGGGSWNEEVKELLVSQSKYVNWRGIGRPEQSPMELAL
ncbi:MAG TPA: hypothetical protein VHQ21_11980 [Rhodanobacteraceae bacterium]|nr:hypothetical protein [Rhodanobacteraceae bacterium]